MRYFILLFLFFPLSSLAGLSPCDCFYNMRNNGWMIAQVLKSSSPSTVSKKLFRPYTPESEVIDYCREELQYLSQIPYCSSGQIIKGEPSEGVENQESGTGTGQLQNLPVAIWNFDIEFIQQQQTLTLSGELANDDFHKKWNIHCKIMHSGRGKSLHVIGSNIVPLGSIGKVTTIGGQNKYEFGTFFGDGSAFTFSIKR